ncbi:hypothetical protein GCM10010245_90930 [Streptomyces spectabilis]|nr:hypothetical protein GCM10010245_90930 [Streptomyces spectabilis]
MSAEPSVSKVVGSKDATQKTDAFRKAKKSLTTAWNLRVGDTLRGLVYDIYSDIVSGQDYGNGDWSTRGMLKSVGQRLLNNPIYSTLLSIGQGIEFFFIRQVEQDRNLSALAG